jgi:two-component system response regulator DevR
MAGHQPSTTSTTSTIRVFLVDDHALIRRGLQDLLSESDDIEIVGQTGSAREAVVRIPQMRPDVAVLDIRLPDGSGIEVCRVVRARSPSVRVIMLSSFHEHGEVRAALTAGAQAYILKSVTPRGLVDSVRRVAAGGTAVDAVVPMPVQGQVRINAGPAPEPRLTAVELRVLHLVAAGLTNRQIASRLHLSEKTVKNYVSHVLAKLGLQSRTQAAVYAVEHRGTPTSPGIG